MSLIGGHAWTPGRTATAHLRLWRELVGVCWRRAPMVSTLVVGCLLVNVVSFAAIGLALKLTVDSAAVGRAGAAIAWAVVAAVAFAADKTITDIAFTMRIHLAEKVGLTEVETAIMRACAGLPEIDHLERTEFLDHITAVRGRAWAIVGSAWTAISSVSLVLRLALTLAVLGSVSPWLLLLLPVIGVQMWLDRRGQAHIRRANLEAAEDLRLQRHLYEVCTSGGAGKEIRVAGAAEELNRRQQAAWQRVLARRVKGSAAATGWSAVGWTVFVAGFTAALGLVVRQATAGDATVGDVMLAVTIGAQLRGVVEMAVFTSMDASGSVRVLEPYLWLRRYVEQRSGTGGSAPAPDRLRHGIDLDRTTFTYPGTNHPAVDGVTAYLPAGSVVAIVGEYGSGKTTLVKLLAKLYRPDSGSVRVDGTDLSDIDTQAWRSAMSAAFQDFGRYQTSFADGVGMGDIARADDPAALSLAIDAADTADLVARLPDGVDTELGSRFGGTELSEGQWQKVALARACLRAHPLLFVLDEPTASLDAPSEHAVFERYLARSRTIAATGAITVIISHRFSTVAGADLILVMAQGKLVEAGSHEQLLARSGTYAELYGAQAAAYAR